MKVLEIISSLGPTGGGETFAVNFCREMQLKSKLRVVILHKNNKDYFIRRLKEKGIQPVILNKKRHLDFATTKQLRKIILDFNPDIIHTENNAIISTFFALRKTKYKNRINVFHTLHLAPEYECENKFVKMIYKHIFKKKNYIPVAISKELARQTSLFFNRESVPFVNNGIDLIPFESNKKLEEREYDIVVVGRFSYPKNHKFLLRVFSKLRQTIPSLRVALVGGGELFDEIKAMAIDLHLLDCVDFKGVLDCPAEIVNNSKIIVLGSIFEANPLSLIEGMSSGCIVVSSNVGGIPDIIHEPNNGFLFEVNNDKRLLEILADVLKNIEIYNAISDYNKKYAKQFSIEKCTDDYLNLFLARI